MLLHHFFALACPADLGASMVRWRVAWLPGGRPVPADRLHLTLIFTGRLDEARLSAAQALAAGLEVPRFWLQLDQLELWRGGLVVLTPGQPPAPLLRLAERLATGLASLGIAAPPQPFRPHLTLCRRYQGELPPAPRWSWPVTEFLLCASHREPDGTLYYRTLGRWPLAA